MMNRKTAVFIFWKVAWQQSKNMLKCDIWRHSASTKNRRSCTLYREQYVNGWCDWKTFHKNNSRRSLIWMNTAIDTNHCQWYAVRRSTVRLNDKANSLWWRFHLTEDSKQENSSKIVHRITLSQHTTHWKTDALNNLFHKKFKNAWKTESTISAFEYPRPWTIQNIRQSRFDLLTNTRSRRRWRRSSCWQLHCFISWKIAWWKKTCSFIESLKNRDTTDISDSVMKYDSKETFSLCFTNLHWWKKRFTTLKRLKMWSSSSERRLFVDNWQAKLCLSRNASSVTKHEISSVKKYWLQMTSNNMFLFTAQHIHMTTTPKIPDTRYFNLVELKKKWRIRTAKLSIRGEFDEVITKQRITMFFDFSKEEEMLEEAEKELSAAKYDSKNQLLDTDDEWSMSNKVKRLDERVTKLKQRLESLKEQHKDFTFFWKVAEHKLKVSDWIVTEIVFQIDKKTIDRFDEMSSHLPNYRMITVDHNERLALQKTWMLDTIAIEVWTKFEWTAEKDEFVLLPVKASKTELKPDKKFEEIVTRKMSEWKLAKEMIQVFDSLMKAYDWRTDELITILEWSKKRLEKIQSESSEKKSLLQIAIADCNWSASFASMITLASAFNFVSIIQNHEK